MGIIYVPYGTVRVSRRWRTVLRAADRAGVRFHVTSGHRSFDEQRALVAQKGLWSPTNKTGAASPSHTAPHIRTGRHCHAIDVNSLDGGETRLERWVESQGADWRNTVPGEAWHGELTGRALARLARKIRRQERRRKREAKAKRAAARKAQAAKPATRMSEKGVEFLIREEGLVPHAYNDPAGHATFGVGHLLHLGPVTVMDRLKWGSKEHPLPDARARAQRVLRTDLELFERAVRAVGVSLNQHEFDALVSLAFNIGAGGFATSTVVKRLKAGNRKGAADAILMWDKPAMLKPRRRRERTLFLTGRYGR